MYGNRYRLRNSIFAIHSDEHHHKTTISLPQGSVVKVIQEDINDGVVDVIWEGKIVMMFVVDLQGRCDMVRTAG